MSLSDRLREAREAAGLSQGQVAKKLNLHRPTVTEIEAGRRKVSTAEIEQFSKLYGVSIDWLVNGTPEDPNVDQKVFFAARELSKMSRKDIDRLMKMLRTFRKPGRS